MVIFYICVIAIGLGFLLLAQEEGEPIFFGIGIALIVVTFIVMPPALTFLEIQKQKEETVQVVSLPEEIHLANENDTLYVVRKTKDTIYIGFRKYKNQ